MTFAAQNTSKRFPKFENHADAGCFKCTGILVRTHESGFAKGRGAHVAYCSACEVFTWYDLKPERRAA